MLELKPGASNLRFEGLQIAYSQRTTIMGEGVSNISVINCSIFGAGGGGANLTGSGIRLVENEISGIGGTALLINGGNNVTLERSGNVVHGNRLHNFARWFRTYHPGVVVNGVGNTISVRRTYFLDSLACAHLSLTWKTAIRFQENHIHTCPHAAILPGPHGQLNLYEGNLIEHAVQEGQNNLCLSASLSLSACFHGV